MTVAWILPFVVAAHAALADAAVLGVRADAEEARRAFAAGSASFDAGDLNGAERQFAAAAQLLPDWGLAHLELGIARLALDPRDPRALASLSEAVRLDPDNARAHLQLGYACEHQGRSVQAEYELRRAVALRPELHEARFALAGLLAASGRDDEAIETYLELLDRSPNDVAALAALAELYERSGKNDLAESSLLTIVRLYPSITYHRYRLAQFYERVGEPLKASRVFRELEILDPRQRKMRALR
jgi:tetratricopeptide (TPR) repeat protein